ncbi:succinate dehydrogenase flavoprotein subunit [Candidatus Synchoanobacter obligatus]|uniref:Succinate dehydrogenase flavoprotein subunit n=1 Tax=Candidatus Synchoanobacter obligatus TaxID=2919597 RepID=A0ABT1L3V1_9GAMM|nr:succinate dehydrogenase flavoprotein subunit [Candidatus Synchoanobacter obligatus]MCP8351869.1 succinate dehydrogenase flavoprotein subunit [Candidatus Synchoanobacter obligatus]
MIAVKAFDAIVIGGGGAGLRAALALGDAGKKIAVISKVFPTRSHTVAAQGGINAALGNVQHDDDWRYHFYDTVLGSDFLGDQDAIEYMCKEAPRTIIELEHMGLPFSRDENGKIYQRAFGGQSRFFGKEPVKRTCAAADRTGHALLHTLYQQNVAKRTQFFNEWFVLDLVKNQHGAVVGVSAIDIVSGELCYFMARQTVLATGGAGRIYHSSTNAYICTGDGLAMAWRAGICLQDMEMWQFHPTGLYGSGILISEGTRGEGGRLLNSQGDYYMTKYSSMADLACRDIVARSSMEEIIHGRGCGPKKDHVLLDIRELSEETIAQKLPGITEISKIYAGIDPKQDPIPVVPTVHYLMGGIPTTPYGEVINHKNGKDEIVPGLFAAGECACVSVHGANRLGANSLLDIVVFGRAVGQRIQEVDNASQVQEASRTDIEAAFSAYYEMEERTEGDAFVSFREPMQRLMQDDFGVYREEEKMQKGLGSLQELRQNFHKSAYYKDKSSVFNTSRIEAFEMRNLLDVAVSTAQSALTRKESRGAHSRVDYPKRDDQNWLCHSIVHYDGGFEKRMVNNSPKEVEPVALKERH